MKTIIAAIVFGLIIIAIVIMVIINFSYKGLRKIKEEAEENYYRNQKLKEQKEKNPFSNDYFKSAGPTKKAQPKKEKQEPIQTEQPKKDKNPFGDDYFKSESDAKNEQDQKERAKQAQKEKTARSKTTDSGVTIVDEREEKRKIFDHSDGEYVEFEEV